ncbi:MAG: hypothetical protein IH585_15525 [Anaerolineaceae bacterium]|nr:hypothetical protein [Anaerolineaceae bacterium]
MNAAMTLILACLGIFGFFVLLFGFLLLLRYLNYREKIKLAEKGIYPQEAPETKPKKGLLVAGWIITIIGFLSTVVFWLFGISITGSGMGNNFPLGLGPWVLLGLFPLLLGLILLMIYVVKAPSNGRYHNGNDKPSDKEEINPSENN